MIRVKFEPRDIWIGVYVDTVRRRVYVCLLPMLPIIFSAAKEAR